MFEVGASTSFRALHRMPEQPPPENELHSHDYRVEVVAERERLDERGMVCDLDVVTGDHRTLPDGDIAALNNSFGFGGHNVALVIKSV